MQYQARILFCTHQIINFMIHRVYDLMSIKIKNGMKATVAMGLYLTSLALQADTAPIPFHVEDYTWNTGNAGTFSVSPTDETFIEEQVVFEGAPWLQLIFDKMTLDDGSYIEISSSKDGSTQKLTAKDLQNSGYKSAYFNGDRLNVRFFPSEEETLSAINIESVKVGEMVSDSRIGTQSICGSDNRVASSEGRVARIDPIGCTAWIAEGGTLLTAGHCLDGGARNEIISFNPPTSLPDGTVQFPGPEDQYRININSFDYGFTGIGNDWGTFTVQNNNITGLQPIAAQGFFRVAQDANASNIRITGFGVDSGSTNQTNQTHVGSNAGSSGTTLRYTADTEGGNSGSPVVDESTGIAIGIHTNGGCRANGGSNSGTSFLNTRLWDIVSAPVTPTPTPAPVTCSADAIDLRSVNAYSNNSTGNFSVSDNGCAITLEGNIWRITSEQFDINTDTTVTFTFSASNTAEIQGVGFDSDTGASANRIFRLTGTQNWGIDDFSYTGNGATQTFTIPVGEYFTGNNMGFVIANDKDSGTTNNVITVSNVIINN